MRPGVHPGVQGSEVRGGCHEPWAGGCPARAVLPAGLLAGCGVPTGTPTGIPTGLPRGLGAVRVPQPQPQPPQLRSQASVLGPAAGHPKAPEEHHHRLPDGCQGRADGPPGPRCVRRPLHGPGGDQQ